MLAEGCYPYVVGGVSSWVQMMIEGFPEYEFFIYAVGANASDRGKFKYKFPPNLVGIQEVFLDEILNFRSTSLQENILSAEERQCILDLVLGEKPIDLAGMIKLFEQGRRRRDILSIFMSSDFFDIINQVYKARYSYLPFTDFSGPCGPCCCRCFTLSINPCRRRIFTTALRPDTAVS